MAKKKAKKAKKTAAKRAPKKKAKKAKKPVRKAAKAAKKAAPKAAKRKKAAPKVEHKEPVLPWRAPLPGETKVGVVDDYFGHIGVIAFALEKSLSAGQKIHVRGHTTDLVQAVESMQIGHQVVSSANPGDSVGIKVNEKCRAGDYVYLAP